MFGDIFHFTKIILILQTNETISVAENKHILFDPEKTTLFCDICKKNLITNDTNELLISQTEKGCQEI